MAVYRTITGPGGRDQLSPALAHFCRFLARQQLRDPVAVYATLPHTMASFAWWLCEGGLAATTALTYMRRIGNLYQAASEGPEWINLHQHVVLRSLATRVARAFAVTESTSRRDPAPIEVIRACVTDRAAPIGLRAVVATSFDLCLRLGEILNTPLGGAAGSNLGPLPKGRIRWSGRGYSLRLYRKVGASAITVTCMPGDSYHHPVAVGSERWLREALAEATRYGWPSPFMVQRNGRGAAINADMVGDLLQRHANRLRLQLTLTGHSIRSGSATEAHLHGMSDDYVRALGGWRSDTFRLYVVPLLASNRAAELIDDDDEEGADDEAEEDET